MKPRAYCPVYELRPNVKYKNKGTFAKAEYKLKIPSVLSKDKLPAPEFVTYEKLTSLRTSGNKKKHGLGTLGGMVKANFQLRFPTKSRQWKPIDGGKLRQFHGGVVCMDVEIALYIWDYYKPKKGDPVGREIFEVVMEHELLHIGDAVDMARNWAKPQIYGDRQIKRMLSNAQPLLEKEYKHWIEGRHLSEWIKGGIWVPEHNRRAALRDAPQEYKKLSKRINDLEAKRTIKP